jgi:hypothetical protein
MSPWHAGIGLFFIALAAYALWRDVRPPVLRTAPRSHDDSGQARSVRRKAWGGLQLAVIFVVIGVGWLTSWNEHWFYVWLMIAVLVVVASWDLSAWLRSRKKRKSSGQPVQMP